MIDSYQPQSRIRQGDDIRFVGKVMRRIVFVTMVWGTCAAIALAEEVLLPAEELVHPARYRIRVEFDRLTMSMIRREIRGEVEKAMAERRRRLRESREEVEEQLRKELKNYDAELAAIRKAWEQEEGARTPEEAAIWRQIRIDRIQSALDLAARAKLIEKALLDLSLSQWRADRAKDKVVADAALAHLERLLARVRAEEKAVLRKRGAPFIPPPHQ